MRDAGGFRLRGAYHGGSVQLQEQFHILFFLPRVPGLLSHVAIQDLRKSMLLKGKEARAAVSHTLELVALKSSRGLLTTASSFSLLCAKAEKHLGTTFGFVK